MKKVLALSLFLLFVTICNGQSQLSYGIHTGITNSNLTNSTEVRDELEEGITSLLVRPNTLMIGLVIGYNLTDNISVITEVNYLSKGYKERIKGEMPIFGNLYTIEKASKVIFKSVEIPLMIRYKFGEDIKFYTNVGPYFNILMSGRSIIKGSSTLGGEITNLDSDSKIIFGDKPNNHAGEDHYTDGKANRLDIGAYIGFGAAKELGPGSVVLDLRYGIGFTDLNNFEDADKPDDYKAAKFNNLTFSLGYVMNF